jgi:uncharacterized YccA/Bax inhibitor family protein
MILRPGGARGGRGGRARRRANTLGPRRARDFPSEPRANIAGVRNDNAPQRIDSVVRTMTAAILALLLVGACVSMVVSNPNRPLGATGAALFALASTAVGFFFGGHVAQNTAALEEARLSKAAAASEASAVRSEAAAGPVVAPPIDPVPSREE